MINYVEKHVYKKKPPPGKEGKILAKP
jgi:hypothetical protein